jgi:YD repeat-containing protein
MNPLTPFALQFVRNVILASLFIVMLIALFAARAGAQTSHSTDGTTPLGLSPGSPAGSYSLGAFDNINLFNGNANITFPMLHDGGRGGAGMTMLAALNTKHWHVEGYTLDGSTTYHAQPNWWATLDPGYGPGVLLGRSTGDHTHQCTRNVSPYDNYNIYLHTLTRLTFIGPDGTEYELRDQSTNGQPLNYVSCNNNFVGASRGTAFTTSDGSSITFVSDSTIYDNTEIDNGLVLYPSGYLLMPNGTRYRIDGGLVSWIRDRNGNKLTFTYDSYARVQTVTDSLNRVVTVTYDVQDGTYGGLYDKIVFSGSQGATRVIHIAKTALGNALRNTQAGDVTSAQTGTQLFGSFGYSGTYNPTVINAIYLPDNDSVTRKYQIFYNPYAEVTRIVLPTGGALEYDMASGLGIIGAEPYEIYRRVIERRTYADGSTLESKETFSATYNVDTDAQPWYTTVTTDHLSSSGTRLARETHYFNGSAAASLIADQGSPYYYYPVWNEGQEYQTEALDANGTTVLRRTNTNYAQRASVSWWSGGHEPANDPRVTDTTTTLTDVSPNLVSKKTFSYVPDSTSIGLHNNVSDTYEYDFGSGSAPTYPTRHTHTDYVITNNSVNYPDPANGSTYTASDLHLRGLAKEQKVYSVNTSTGAETLVADSTSEYDNYASSSPHASLVPRSSISGLDAAFTTSYPTRERNGNNRLHINQRLCAGLRLVSVTVPDRLRAVRYCRQCGASNRCAGLCHGLQFRRLLWRAEWRSAHEHGTF